MAKEKFEWLLVSDDLFACEIKNAKSEQRYVYEVDTEKYHFQFEDEEPVEMEVEELDAELVESLKKALKE